MGGPRGGGDSRENAEEWEKGLANKTLRKVGAGGTPRTASPASRGELAAQSLQQSEWALSGRDVLPDCRAGSTLLNPAAVQISA